MGVFFERNTSHGRVVSLEIKFGQIRTVEQMVYQSLSLFGSDLVLFVFPSSSGVVARERTQLHDDLQVTHLGPQLLDLAVRDAEDEDARFLHSLVGRWDIKQTTAVCRPARVPGNSLVTFGDDVMHCPFRISEGGQVPLKPEPESLPAMAVGVSSLTVGDEVRADEFVDRSKIAPGKQVSEPPVDDLSMLAVVHDSSS
jgi:hypothetical protein